MYVIYHDLGNDVGQIDTVLYNESLFNPESFEAYLRMDSVPEPEVIEGKAAAPFIKISTMEIYYEYRDMPKTLEDRLTLAEAKNGELQQAIADLTMTMAALMVHNEGK